MRYVLLGDGDSPHLLKWARGLRAADPALELWAASSRGFMAGFEATIPGERRLALATRPDTAGGNVGLLRELPRLVRWLRQVDADWLHAHYLSSHGTLAWLACRFGGLRAGLLASAWGSDILVAPEHSAALRWATRRVLRHAALATSDSQHMAVRMRALGAGEVCVFPFGLEVLPPVPARADKDPGLWFANRGLEPIYAPERALRVFARHAQADDRLVVANDGRLRPMLEALAGTLGIAARTRFVGRLAPDAQDECYARASWYLSLPTSDSVAVSVLEAMAHGCVPLLSDLPANRELVRDGDNGLIVPAHDAVDPGALDAMRTRAGDIAVANHAWVAGNAVFAPAVAAFLARVRALPR